MAFWFGNDDGEREKRGERAKSGGNHSRRETLPLRRPTACTRLTMVAPMRVAAGRAKVAASAPGRASHSQGPRSKYAPNAPQLVPCIALCPRAAARAIALRPNATVRPPIAALAPLRPSRDLDLDPDLREVLELCDEGELEAVHGILNGLSPFSPLAKSLSRSSAVSSAASLHDRFLFLAADAGESLAGRRPSYRETLLRLGARLGARVSPGLAVADLEVELLAAMLGQGDGGGGAVATRGAARAPSAAADATSTFAAAVAATALSAARSTLLKPLAARALARGGAVDAALAAALRRGGSAAAVRTAARGAATAAARHSAAATALAALSAASWALLAADLGWKAVGTDWARVSRAVAALASVRLLRTHGFTNEPVAEPVASPPAPPAPRARRAPRPPPGPGAAAHA